VVRKGTVDDDELKVVMTASNEPEAEMMRVRLLSAGIHAISQRAMGGPEWGGSGVRYVLVPQRDLARARELLESDGSISEEELARQSDEAGREQRGQERPSGEPPAEEPPG
jgi:hypothetical protein